MVYKTDSVDLIKKGKEWVLTVNWEGEQRKFWINFPWPLLSITKQEKIDDLKKSFTIKAKTVETLREFLKDKKNRINYDDAIVFLYDIGNQLQTLERFYMGIPFLDIDDIIVIDKRHFFYLNDSKIYNFSGDKTIEIETIYKKGLFISPEFSEMLSIPHQIHYKSGFYSLASLITFSMFNQYINQENKMELLDPINTTKLYWALLRMLEYTPSARFYLII
tara:strand:+ start:4505 stop:5164 length:660 start_codon:yes stop_codon:yes gene_type:complete